MRLMFVSVALFLNHLVIECNLKLRTMKIPGGEHSTVSIVKGEESNPRY